MKQKSVTFRCSDSLLNRMEDGMLALKNGNRTDFISKSLEEFLAFVETEEIRKLDLFALVKRVDNIGAQHSFSHDA